MDTPTTVEPDHRAEGASAGGPLGGEPPAPETARYRVLVYAGSGNIGDMMQTAAITRLLPQTVGIYRTKVAEDLHLDLPFVLNGYLNQSTSQHDTNTLFAGVFVGAIAGGNKQAHYDWMKRSKHPVGARDPYTAELMRRAGVDASFIGCATITLPHYEGPREGVYSVDTKGPGKPLRNAIPREMPMAAQWALAMERLELLRRAQAVYTTRLHVALPCLAMGTPVHIEKPTKRTLEPERFSIVDALQIPYGKLVTFDMFRLAANYIAFLEAHLGVKIVPGEFKRPLLDGQK
jgi:hypothetical protein